MDVKTIVEIVLLAIIAASAIALLPDFVRYIKIRSM